jgi:hypothetical protein
VLIALVTMLFTLNQSFYAIRLENSGMFDNSLKTAMPQTVVAGMVEAHFNAPLPAGKTVKKCFIFGYDGARCDGIINLKGIPSSAVNYIAASGGLYVAYAGGASKYFNTQATSTAPGWASILTGKWATENGVKNNGYLLSSDTRTILTSLVESGKADSSVFYCSWDGHITGEDATYREEAKHTAANNINVRWETYSWDDTMHAAMVEDVRSDACADILFCTYERPDAAGHGIGFSNDVPEYVEAIKLSDRDAFDLVKLIEARDTYQSEDWLFIITSDHGGKGTGHGSQNVDCRTTFIAANKAIDTAD